MPAPTEPTIEELKQIQSDRGLECHVVFLGDTGFVVAHTDEERAELKDLRDCKLHQWLVGRSEAPHPPGYYRVERHRADGYSESYRGDAGPWDFSPLMV